jgi:hypothetical protein
LRPATEQALEGFGLRPAFLAADLRVAFFVALRAVFFTAFLAVVFLAFLRRVAHAFLAAALRFAFDDIRFAVFFFAAMFMAPVKVNKKHYNFFARQNPP